MTAKKEEEERNAYNCWRKGKNTYSAQDGPDGLRAALLH